MTARALLALLLILSSAARLSAADFLFSGTPLSTAARTIARVGGFNLVLDHEVPDGPVEMQVRNVEAEVALDLLARSRGLVIHRFGANTRVLAPPEATERYENSGPVLLRLHETDAETVLPSLRNAFPHLRFAAAGPERIAVAGALAGDHEELVRFLGELDRGPAAADIRLTVVRRGQRDRGKAGMRLQLREGSPGRRLVVDTEAVLQREEGQSSGHFVLGGRVRVGHELRLFQGKSIPYRSDTSEVHTAEAGDGGSLILISASPAAIVLDVDLEHSQFLGPSVWQGSTGSRLTTRVSLRPGETVVIGGLDDVQTGSGREDWLLRRWESGESSSLITVSATLAD